MNWITAELAVGSHKDASDVVRLGREDVRAVLGLIDTLAGADPAAYGLAEIVVVPLHDGPGNAADRFRDAVDALERLIRAHGRVLVHCHYGHSRAPTVAAGYLMRSLGLSKIQALARVAAKRECSPSAGMEAMLDDFAS